MYLMMKKNKCPQYLILNDITSGSGIIRTLERFPSDFYWYGGGITHHITGCVSACIVILEVRRTLTVFVYIGAVKPSIPRGIGVFPKNKCALFVVDQSPK